MEEVKRNSSKNNKRYSCLIIVALVVMILGVFSYKVTKEVMDAFDLLDKGLSVQNETFGQSNNTLSIALINHSDYAETVRMIEKISAEYNALMDSTINQLIIESGGWKDDKEKGELVNPKNINVSNRILVTEKLGNRIQRSIESTSAKYNEILKSQLEIDTIQLPLKLEMGHISNSGKTWSEYNFEQMPLIAVLPILQKFKSDEKESKYIIYSQMANRK